MEKIVYCCDICEKEIEGYDKNKDSVVFLLPSKVVREDNLPVTKPERHDVCLTCLSRAVQVFSKVQGGDISSKFLKILLGLRKEG